MPQGPLWKRRRLCERVDSVKQEKKSNHCPFFKKKTTNSNLQKKLREGKQETEGSGWEKRENKERS